MRGKAFPGRLQDSFPGITPAYAGKRSAWSCQLTHTRDHPRVCGEKGNPPEGGTPATGSPPRMRGKVSQCPASRAGPGITPAYAGKRFCYGWQKPLSGDHPRVCGEKVLLRLAKAPLWGSPPRMRGKAPDVANHVEKTGITPAYAGKRLKRSHSIGHFSCILCLFHSVLHRASASGGSRAGPCAPPCLPAQNAVPV